jgi:hypothetical protein
LFAGARSFHIEDTDDEEVHPPNASSAETQMLLSVEDQIPRYNTASPCKYKYCKNYM